MSMSRISAMLIYLVSGILAAISQLLLKIAADGSKQKAGYRKFLDIRIIIAYSLLFLTIFMNMIAMRYLPYKYTPVLATISYIFVLLLSHFYLHEKISKKQSVGTILIFLGIIVFGIS